MRKHTCHLDEPPQISLSHDWARGEVPLGSAVDQQSEGEVVRPICDRSGQQENTQGVFVVNG